VIILVHTHVTVQLDDPVGDHDQTTQYAHHGTAHLDGEFISLRMYDRLIDEITEST
jgi:hypothetical protein